ncbi:protein phosphatase Slingshot isoform X2 [Chrysoperla carnea]|uniref:protein phosphatase Slingshot isoform X2 n=1 Tax=Chrysoperla carnea TaxID=189513 RepID=UPI001D0938FF|nr:protein phosphatase Slingshot isoform X2 [Chrysoperla carnea]
MALVTVQRSPSVASSPQSSDSGTGVSTDEDDTTRGGKSLSECYFAGKGAAVVLPPHERLRPSRRVSASGSDIQQHLQSMFYLLRPEETLKMAVKLESAHAGRTRYLVVVSCSGRQDAEESCLLGIDCNERTTVGLVLRVLADTAITLDGDGGFSVSVCGSQHIFKPVSVQAMWSALQTLHKVSSKAREQNYFLGGLTHDWVSYYEQKIESDRSCLNEWHAMDNLESRRPPSPDSLRTKPRERDETERVIRATLKEIMMSVDLDEVTSKYIRSRLEEELDMDLDEFKSFIDQEMLVILGQMDAPTEIFEHVYLGSEWNASNLEELQKNGVGHILNVTREIDNFFPGMFDYLNIRVYDDEKTDLLKHWDNTFKYITRAKKEGSKVLVHCKMGVSRSASVVIAYAMKAYNWDFDKAIKHVKEKRNCIKPNSSFLAQLETYQGILDAMKNKEKLQRSKSETNLKSPDNTNKTERIIPGSEPTPMIQALHKTSALQSTLSGQDLRQIGDRPKSWSPDNILASNLLPLPQAPTSVSLEQLNNKGTSSPPSSKVTFTTSSNKSTSQSHNHQTPPSPPATEVENRNVLMPCENGQVYSVSPNHIFHLPCRKSSDATIPSVKHYVNELESQTKNGARLQPDKKGLVLNLTSQFKNSESKPSSPECDGELQSTDEKTLDVNQQHTPQMLTAVLVKKEIWDPGEKEVTTVSYNSDGVNNVVSYKTCDVPSSPAPPLSSQINGDNNLVWTSSTRLIEKTKDNSVIDNNRVITTTSEIDVNSKRPTSIPPPILRRDGDPFSNKLDKVFDREERKQQRQSTIGPTPLLPQCVTDPSSDSNLVRECPSRQSSWSSYDSAVVLGYPGDVRDIPSRHSSWGSGDARTLPSRNSSWGSYDMKPNNVSQSELIDKKTIEDIFCNSSCGMFAYDKDDIPGYPGTVKRTKQKLEENGGDPNKKICITTDFNSDMTPSTQPEDNIQIYNTIPPYTRKIDIQPKTLSSSSSAPLIGGTRLSVSAPERSITLLPKAKSLPTSNSTSNIMKLCCGDVNFTKSSVKKHKLFLESLNSNNKSSCNLNKGRLLHPKRCFSVDSSTPESTVDQTSLASGIVKSLKREFEAKVIPSTNHDNNKISDSVDKPVKSLPASPVSTHIDIKERHTPEDLSVKKLVGKYEERKEDDIEAAPIPTTHIPTTRPKEIFEKRLLNSLKTPSSNITTSDVKKYPPPITKTSLLVRNLKNGCDAEFKRPPVPPTVVKSSVVPNMVLASVVTTAASKKQQQHGKTHPLTRLTINKQRHNNPVYNTM